MSFVHPFSGSVKKLAGALLVPLSLPACDSAPSAQAVPPPARFEAVAAKKLDPEKEFALFCDIRDTGPLTLPPIEELPPVPAGARWVNVWATWCKSCVEELPRIESWRRQHGFSVTFLSADEDEDALSGFRSEHPDLPLSASLKEPEQLSEWMQSLGLDAGAGLPLHLFVSSSGEVRCARAAAVADRHLPVIAKLLE